MKLMHMITAAALVAFTSSAFAQSKKATAQTYKIDTKASTILWKGTKAVGSGHDGNVSIKDGQLLVDKKTITGGNFTVDMATITNNDLKDSPEYQTKLVNHLKSEDFFNVAKYPTSTFKINSVEKKSDTEVLIKGDLTMIGQTKPVEFPATVKWEGDKVTGTANVKLDRTIWGLKYGSGKFFKNLGDKMINDQFDLTLNLVAKK